VDAHQIADVRWHDLPGLWRAAGARQRLAVVLPPLLVPVLIFVNVLAGAVFGALVLMVCTVVAVFRGMALLWRLLRRRGRTATLLRWRMLLAWVLAAASIALAMASYNAAQFQARDMILALDKDAKRGGEPQHWICGDATDCRIPLGFPLLKFNAWADRSEQPDGWRYDIRLALGPDSTVRFTASTHAPVEIVSHADHLARRLDPADLTVMDSQ